MEDNSLSSYYNNDDSDYIQITFEDLEDTKEE